MKGRTMTDTIIVRYRETEIHIDGIDGNVSITSWKADYYLGRMRYMSYGIWEAALVALQKLYPDDRAENIDYVLAEQGLYPSEYDYES